MKKIEWQVNPYPATASPIRVAVISFGDGVTDEIENVEIEVEGSCILTTPESARHLRNLLYEALP